MPNLVPRSYSVLPLAVGDLGTRLVDAACFVDQKGFISELTDLFDDRIVIDINYIH